LITFAKFTISVHHSSLNLFRTELSPAISDWKITHKSQILSVGSCFAENIGARLSAAKFPLVLNPFGIVYNPISVENALNHLIDNQQFTKEDVFFHKERYHSFSHHSRFSHSDENICLQQINTAIQTGHEQFRQTDVLLVTLGTAHVFFHKHLKRVVNNCHQLPANDFERRLLHVNEIGRSLAGTFKLMKILRPNIRIILTISPVRHIRDGLQESKLSKSILRVAADELCGAFNFVEYFPSYEIMSDDLRDYRFYAPDMVHPNEVAVDYIWQKFLNTYFDENTKQVIQQTQKLRQAMQHRPFNPDSEAHQAFLAKHLQMAKDIKKTHPHLDMEDELSYFSS